MTDNLNVPEIVEPLSPEDSREVARLNAIEIRNAEELTDATDGLVFLQQVRRGIEKARKAAVGPYNEKVKSINTVAKTMLKPIDSCVAHLKLEIAEWHAYQEKLRLEEQQRVERENAERRRKAEEAERLRLEAEQRATQEAREAGFTEGEVREHAKLEADEVAPRVPLMQEVPPPPPEQTARSTLGTATVRKVWTFEIEDVNKIPRMFMKVDEVQIRAAIRAGHRSIPGIRIYQEAQVAGRAAK